MESFDAAIIGGGPAGSACALYLRELGMTVCLIERSRFPRETVCGEFLSNEVTKSLKELGLFEDFLHESPNAIDAFRLHSERGRSVGAELGFTAYGMKRGTFDHMLLASARERGACVIQPGEVSDVVRAESHFVVHYRDAAGGGTLSAARVVGAYGKRNILDKRFRRAFTGGRSRLNGVKFHIARSLCPGITPQAIHLFTGSHLYCGVNVVDDDMVTVCFLEQRTAGGEQPRRQLTRLIAENAAFRACFTDAFTDHCKRAPLYGTGDIFFGTKEAVVDGIFMTGDAADVIAPLTGDGMGMAFEGARIIAEVFEQQRSHMLGTQAMEALYRRRRAELFSTRLRIAGWLQTTLLSPLLRPAGVSAITAFPNLLPRFIALTRG